MSAIIHYEVYVYQNSTWDLLGRYSSEQRSKAIEYARSIENTERKPTKVVRETYDLDTQTFQEAMVYLSEIPKPQPPKSSPYANSVIPTAVKRNDQKKSGLAEGVIMIFLSIIFSMILSCMITVVTLRVMALAGFSQQDISGQFVLGTFTFFFLVISIPTAIKWVKWENLLGSDEKKSSKTAALYPTAKETDDDDDSKYSKRELYEIGSERSEKPDSLTSRLVRRIFDAFDVLSGRKTLTQRLKEAEEAAQEKAKQQEAEEQAADEERQKQEEEKTGEEQTEQAAPETPADAENAENETDETENDETPPAPAKETGHVEIPPELEKDYLTLTTFLSIILRVLQEKNTLLNTYARFGIELFLSGACERLCRSKSLSPQQNRVMLAGLLELLGRAPTLAELFFDKIEEYMMEPKYLTVIENGSKGMETYLNNKSSPELIGLIQTTMANWLNPKKETVASGICTVMFTDIVSSTHMTQTLGDRMAQQLIHRHNTIVRQALSTCGGEEIKQTGDGIMASFMWASNAIDAAIAIQKAVSLYNRESPTVALEVRIGLNAGEPIVENNDLFGLTVQLASRVCGEAGKNQIYVSSVVKELAAGKNYIFVPRGEFNLKGIDAPQTLYEVVWEEEKPKKQPPKEPEKPAEPPQEKDLAESLPEF